METEKLVFRLAEIAYNAYGVNRSFKTFDGRQMPVWSELSQEIKEAWIFALTVCANSTELKVLDDR